MFSLNDRDRRVATKRFNERVKLLATAMNGSAIVTMGAAVIAPAVGGFFTPSSPFWTILAVVLHILAQAVLGLLRDEG